MKPAEPEKYRGLLYPWGRNFGPQPTEPVEVADGVWWARFKMPMSLDHINVWLLRDGDGWTIVDTCMSIPGAREQWEALFEGFMQGLPVKRVIATHMHPDHVGLAGWIGERFGCSLWMTRAEYLTCRLMAADTQSDIPEVALNFYRSLGWNERQLDRYKKRFGGFGSVIHELPKSYHRLVDSMTIDIGGRYWQVVIGSGHSPEHAALYCPALKLLISGDQVLPRITSNVSVYPIEPDGDPLHSWIRSCSRIRERLPENLLVLPAHQTPFYGLHERLTQLIESHERALEQLYAFLAEPRRVVDCFVVLFNREIDDSVVQMASGEAHAHLNCLINRRLARMEMDSDGVMWFTQRPESMEIEDLI